MSSQTSFMEYMATINSPHFLEWYFLLAYYTWDFLWFLFFSLSILINHSVFLLLQLNDELYWLLFQKLIWFGSIDMRKLILFNVGVCLLLHTFFLRPLIFQKRRITSKLRLIILNMVFNLLHQFLFTNSIFRKDLSIVQSINKYFDKVIESNKLSIHCVLQSFKQILYLMNSPTVES